MKYLLHLPTFILRALCAFVLAAGAFAAAEDEVAQLQTAFMSRYDAVNAQRDEQLTKLETGYLAALDRHVEKVKASGNLEDVISIRDEIEAVKTGTDPLPELPANATSGFKQLRKTYTDAQAAILKTHANSLSDLATKMTDALKVKEVQLTKAGKIDQALAAKNLRETLEEDEGISAARKSLDQTSSNKDDWFPLLKSDWKIELSEDYYVGDVFGKKGKGRYLPEVKKELEEKADGGFPHFLAVPKARVAFNFPSNVTQFETTLWIPDSRGRSDKGDAIVRVLVDGKKVAEIGVDGGKNNNMALKVEFEPADRLVLEFDPNGPFFWDWVVLLSPKVR